MDAMVEGNTFSDNLDLPNGPESNDASDLESPGVYWGPIQSPEKKLLSKLQYDSLSTPLRRPHTLSLLTMSSPKCNEHELENGNEERNTWASASISRDSTPENDALAFEEPTSALAQKVIRAHDNPSPPPSPRSLLMPSTSPPPSSPHALMGSGAFLFGADHVSPFLVQPTTTPVTSPSEDTEFRRTLNSLPDWELPETIHLSPTLPATLHHISTSSQSTPTAVLITRDSPEPQPDESEVLEQVREEVVLVAPSYLRPGASNDIFGEFMSASGPPPTPIVAVTSGADLVVQICTPVLSEFGDGLESDSQPSDSEETVGKMLEKPRTSLPLQGLNGTPTYMGALSQTTTLPGTDALEEFMPVRPRPSHNNVVEYDPPGVSQPLQTTTTPSLHLDVQHLPRSKVQEINEYETMLGGELPNESQIAKDTEWGDSIQTCGNAGRSPRMDELSDFKNKGKKREEDTETFTTEQVAFSSPGSANLFTQFVTSPPKPRARSGSPQLRDGSEPTTAVASSSQAFPSLRQSHSVAPLAIRKPTANATQSRSQSDSATTLHSPFKFVIEPSTPRRILPRAGDNVRTPVGGLSLIPHTPVFRRPAAELMTPRRVPLHKPHRDHIGAPHPPKTDLLLTHRFPSGHAAPDDPVRSPQRVPLTDNTAARPTDEWQGLPMSPVVAHKDDPVRTPQRVPLSVATVTPDEPHILVSSRERRGYTGPKPTSNVRQRRSPFVQSQSHSIELPLAPAGSKMGSASQLPPHALPFPLIPSLGNVLKSSILEDGVPQLLAGPSVSEVPRLQQNPKKSSLRQPSAGAGSRIPRMTAKPYVRPSSKERESRLPMPAKKAVDQVPAHKLTSPIKRGPTHRVGSSSGSSSDDSKPDLLSDAVTSSDGTSANLKRKRGLEKISSPFAKPQPVVLVRRVVSSTAGLKPTSNATAAGPSSVALTPSVRDASVELLEQGIPPRSSPLPDKVDDVLSRGSVDTVIEYANPLPVEQHTDDEHPAKVRRTTRPRKARALHADIFGAISEPGLQSTLRQKAQSLTRPEGILPRTPFTSPHSFPMSAIALRTLTSSNTTKNQQYLAARLQTQVVRKEGCRPESPTTKVKTIMQKQRDGKEKEREDRAVRRARRSDGTMSEGFESGTENENTGQNEIMVTDNAPARLRHRRGAGDDGDYETPDRPGKRGPIDGMDVPEKRVKWDRGLFTTVYLDQLHPGAFKNLAQQKRMDSVGKSCLADSAKKVRLDSLGNVTNTDAPLIDLVYEDIVVTKLVYDDDAVPEPDPVVKAVRNKTKKKSR